MLALALEKLALARGVDQVDVRIFLDTAPEKRLEEVEFVRDTYFPNADIFTAPDHIKVPSGCWNILQSLKAGYQSQAEFVFLVEEDVLVKSDFFQWHFWAHENGDYFVTSGRKLKKKGNDFFSNPGSCYRRENLARVVEHITDAYFANPEGYLDWTFPFMSDAGVLDDGLIRRVMRSVNGTALCPEIPICAHQGFRGYQRYSQFVNDKTAIQDRIVKLREILASIDPNDKFTQDFEPF